MTVMTMMMMINIVMTMLTIALTKDSPPSIWIGLRSRNKWAARNSCQHKSLLITQIICWLLVVLLVVVVEENWKRAAQLDGQLKEGKTLSPTSSQATGKHFQANQISVASWGAMLCARVERTKKREGEDTGRCRHSSLILLQIIWIYVNILNAAR